MFGRLRMRYSRLRNHHILLLLHTHHRTHFCQQVPRPVTPFQGPKARPPRTQAEAAHTPPGAAAFHSLLDHILLARTLAACDGHDGVLQD